MSNVRNNFPDLLLEDALPAIVKVIEEEYKEFPQVGPAIFNERSMSTSIAQTTQVSSLRAAQTVGEGQSIPMQQLYQGFDKTYTARKFGILMGVSQELLDDDAHRIMEKNPRRFARAFATAQEIECADIFNNAFSATGPDGKVLCATDHPALVPGVADQSNLLGTAADLSTTSMKAMIKLLRGTKDTAGNRIMIKPKHLLVSASDEFLAAEILESVLLPNSDNAAVNAINSIKALYGMSALVWDFLTDDDAFFVLGDKLDHELNWFWRKRPELATDEEFKSDVVLTKMTARWVAGYSDWRGIVGTPGT